MEPKEYKEYAPQVEEPDEYFPYRCEEHNFVTASKHKTWQHILDEHAIKMNCVLDTTCG